MIASHSAVAPSPVTPATPWRRGRGLFVLAAGLLSLLAAPACDRVPLMAPTQSTITLYSDSTVIPLNGSAQITATVIESAGTPVQNGTVVNFTTTIGVIEPAEARTSAGKATVRLNTQGRSGNAVVRAFSGGNESGDLELVVGAAAVKTVTLNANPGSVSAIRATPTTLTAAVFDENGNGVSNAPVRFTASAGQLLNAIVNTDSDGIARTTLTTTQQATVQATAGAVQSNTVTVAVNNAPRVGITAQTTAIQTNVPATFTISIATDSGVGIRSARVNWDDGTSNPVSPTGGTIPHTYTSGGSYTIRVTAVDVNGEEGVAELPIIVTASSVLATITPSPNPVRINAPVTFTVTLANSSLTPNIASVEYDFGDGTERLIGGTTQPKIFTRVGNFTVTATVVLTDGRRSQGAQTIVVVIP